MSRSFKKHPIIGNSCAESEKKDKVRAHKKFRRKSKVKVNKIDTNTLLHGDFWDDEPEVVLPEKLEEVSNVYNFAKDGKQYFPKDKKELRK
jgi:hypothetical protein